jgi:hypothetical protein
MLKMKQTLSLSRIEAYFNASFHLIEAVAARIGLHIQKHQKVRSELEGTNRHLRTKPRMSGGHFRK